MKKVYIFGDREKRSNYVEALEASGLEVVVTQNPEDSQECAGLLLPGGGDLDPVRYGAENAGSLGIDPQLDETELSLAKTFVERGKPVFGICRGLQVLNVAFGGDLIQDLPTASAHRWEESTGDKVHKITTVKGSFLHQLYGSSFAVNSAHHQGAGRTAEGFRTAALAEDGGIEALEWPEKRVYAVQFHPERMTLRHRRTDTVDGGEIFRFFAKLVEETKRI